MRIYQVGLEPHYLAHVMGEWSEGGMCGDIRVRKAKTKGLAVVEVSDEDLYMYLIATFHPRYYDIKENGKSVLDEFVKTMYNN
jgi:hypothetical protein